MKNRFPAIIQYSFAACLLMIGFAFFYRYVIFLPQMELKKNAKEASDEQIALNLKNESDRQMFMDKVRGALLSFASIADRTALMPLKENITIGEAIAEYEKLIQETEALRSQILLVGTPDPQSRQFMSVFPVMIEKLREHNNLSLRVANYALQSEELKEEVHRNQVFANRYIGKSAFVFQNDYATALNEVARSTAQAQEKTDMLSSSRDEHATSYQAIVTDVRHFSEEWFPIFGVDSSATLVLYTKLVKQRQEKMENETREIQQKIQYKAQEIAKRFTVEQEGLIIDNRTGLIWKKELAGPMKSFKEAKEYAENLVFANHDDWRLPTKSEFESIRDPDLLDANASVAHNEVFRSPVFYEPFSTTKEGTFYTETEVAGRKGQYYGIRTENGYISNSHGQEAIEMCYARVVRGSSSTN